MAKRVAIIGAAQTKFEPNKWRQRMQGMALEVVQHEMIIPRGSVPMVVVWHAGSPEVVAFGVEACELRQTSRAAR